MQLAGSKLYVSTRDRGLARFDAGAWRSFYPNPGATPDTTFLSSASFFSLLAARDGTLWAGEWGADITRIDDSTEPPQVTHYYGAADGMVPYDVRNTFGWSSAQDAAGNAGSAATRQPRGDHADRDQRHRDQREPHELLAARGRRHVRPADPRRSTFAPGPLFELWVGYARAGVDVFRDPTLATRFAHFSTADNIPNANLSNDDVWAVEFNGDSAGSRPPTGCRATRAPRASASRRSARSSPSSQGAIHPLSIDA